MRFLFFWFLFRLLQFCFSSTLSFKSPGLQLGFLLLTGDAESLATNSFVKKNLSFLFRQQSDVGQEAAAVLNNSHGYLRFEVRRREELREF